MLVYCYTYAEHRAIRCNKNGFTPVSPRLDINCQGEENMHIPKTICGAGSRSLQNILLQIKNDMLPHTFFSALLVNVSVNKDLHQDIKKDR